MNSNATLDAATGVVSFTVTVAGKVVPCRVSDDWLREAYGTEALADGTLRAFNRRRPNIEAAALRAWLASRGAEPVWLKRDHVWRQPAGSPDGRRQAEKLTI